MEKITDEITLDGKRYISVKRAAGLAEYTPDYVGQLCRSGKLDSTRIGRNWYVEESSIVEHKQERSDKKDVAEKEVFVKKTRDRTGIFDGSFVVYSKDERALFPKLKDKTPKVAHISIDIEGESTVNVPDSIFTKTSTVLDSATKSTINLFELSKRASSFAIIVIIAVGLFSLNTPYTSHLLGIGINNLTVAALNTNFGSTVKEEILTPFELAAKEINTSIDDSVYKLLYGDIL